MSEHSERYSFQGFPPRACPGEASSMTNSPGQVSVAASDLSEGAAVIVTDDYEFPPSASATPPPAARSVPGSSSAADDDGTSRARARPRPPYIIVLWECRQISPPLFSFETRGLGQPGFSGARAMIIRSTLGPKWPRCQTKVKDPMPRFRVRR